ncbi:MULTISPECIES: DNA translocase FtsK [unclassified Clostridium]|uniref:FtsK/SpoIIIE family DNA translocase n=1 Tax=unclassified Clostridium TaxID=2614128 RepID=UPI00189A9D43|nr:MULTISPECIES: DNA translocase FtsK [unclassified Clostridium]MBP3916785.1 DNA translocase FtsK 4TM domain-containing protein [Clostridium sp.]MEE0933206.1 DNA translocase FtsK 4TM domain-containing protein [Clostridium sp.]
MGTGSKKRNIKKKGNESDEKKGDVKAVLYIAIGILLAFSTYTDLAGVLSVISRKTMYNMFGIIVYLVPVYLVYFGIDTIRSKGTIKYSRRFFSITVIAIVIWLFCSTMSIQFASGSAYNNESFLEMIKKMHFSNNYSLHGGFFGFLIAYPLSKLIGYIGSYILYSTLFLIGMILLMDITLYDIYVKGKKMITAFIGIGFSKNEVKKEKVRKRKEKNINNDTIEVIVPDGKNEEDEFIKGINNKIQILDFMKNSELQDMNPLQNFNLENTEVYERNNMSDSVSSSRRHSKNLSHADKEVVSKEIEHSINEVGETVKKDYLFPTMDLLNVNSKLKLKNEDKKDLIENANKLEETLSNFGVEAKVVQVTKGPSVTRFELQPSPGVKVSKIVNLQDDIALGLAANGVRMEAPIPGKAAIGIEVPNKKQSPVFLREVLDSKEFTSTNKNLAFALGKDITGKCIVGDLSKMPHMLIAGATGSGKSVCINSLIISLLYKYSPDQVKLLMVDPKVVELSVYNGIPHLLIPVVTDPKKAAGALNWAVNEMNKRYNLFSQMKVKNIESYNNLFDKGEIQEKLPYIVVIVDELADLMMACPNDVEDYICRLAQMARAAGMHLIIATQRPSVDVITGVIKANIPSRVSFAVSSGTDSRTILDQVGAEKLLGRGDMLYYPIGENKPVRVQGAFISEEEVENVVDFIKQSDEDIDYSEDILNHINNEVSTESIVTNEGDELLEEAMKIVVEYQQASTSFIQRKLRVGFNRASRIMDELEERGVISEKDGSKPRQVLIEKEDMYDSQ